MARKKKPLQAPNIPVYRGAVLATLYTEMHELMEELKARRAFDEDVADFVKTKGLADELEAHRTVRRAKVTDG